MDKVLEFYKGKRVFVTGHTGFKGAWLTFILKMAGAKVTGYSIDMPTNPCLFEIAKIKSGIKSITGDINDYESLKEAFINAEPEIVIHLAAQSLVGVGYHEPRHTYETNVMGTVNLLECVRLNSCVRSVLNVTTDKVYENKEWEWGYRENEPLCGYDPYSNSKSCSEFVTRSYNNCFFNNSVSAVSTARSGNVIGGGDFSLNRIIPDCIRAYENGTVLVIRNPDSTRPYQHVLETLFAYLIIAKKQYENKEYSGSYNIGPNDIDNVTTAELVALFNNATQNKLKYNIEKKLNAPHEAGLLKLDCSKMKKVFDWKPRLTIKDAVDLTAEWTVEYIRGNPVIRIMEKQINNFVKGGLAL